MKKKSFIILILIFIVVEIIALVMLNLESFKKDEKTEKNTCSRREKLF